ncbi:MAG: hypothetical protein Q8M18_00680 [Bradyrhizobium sp.]|nr:hypothetical protein [Bradyrhizobium sp.]
MPAQQQNLRKNYIGIVNDRVAEQHAVESPAKSFLRDYFLTLMAAVLKRRGETRS